MAPLLPAIALLAVGLAALIGSFSSGGVVLAVVAFVALIGFAAIISVMAWRLAGEGDQ